MSLAILVISGLAVAPAAQARSFRDYTDKYTDKAKSTASDLYGSAKKSDLYSSASDLYGSAKSGFKSSTQQMNKWWDGLSPETKAGILAGAGAAAAAGAAGVGYLALSGDALKSGVGPSFGEIKGKIDFDKMSDNERGIFETIMQQGEYGTPFKATF